MNERELHQLFEKLQMCVDQLRVMQNLQEKEHSNLYRSILKLDKHVSYLSGQLAAKKGAPPARKRGLGDAKKSRAAAAGDEGEGDEEKRRSTAEELSSNESDSSHAEPREQSPRGKKGRRGERRSRRHRRAKRASDGRAPAAPTGLSDEPLEPNWTGEPVTAFDQLPLKPDLLTGIQASPSGVSEPTRLQQRALPALLQPGDVVVQARGAGADDGKMAAIALAVLNKVDAQQRACQALVLTSSRDAAKQLNRELVGLATFIRPRLACHLSIGGTNIRDDMRDMSAGCHVVVGTLGRAFDMVRRGALKVADLRVLVLDDVDTMMTRRFDKDHMYAVLGEMWEVQARLQLMVFLSMMHEDIPKLLQLFAKPPVRQLLVEAPAAPPTREKSEKVSGEGGDDVKGGTTNGTTNGQLLEDAVLKLAEKLGELAVPEIVVPQPPLPEAMAQGVVEG